MPAISNSLRREKRYPSCGRLIILQRGLKLLNPSENNKQSEAINFPSMPDNIELARRAEYSVTTNLVIPDGVHFYRGTTPLKIPIAFKLHSYDSEYCLRGALSLLQVAATLHALVLPLGNSSIKVTTGMIGGLPGPDRNFVGPTQPSAGSEAQQKAGAATDVSQVFDSTDKGNIFPPVTCYLELMITELNMPGILCNGYVEDVNVKLNGPFLKGPGLSRNLPSSADFAFTFVHHPGHGNAFSEYARGNSSEPQAYAEVVQSRLYNTRSDEYGGNVRGFGQRETDASPFK